MTRFARLEAAFHRVQALDGEQRSALLGRECVDDPDIAADLRAMLQSLPRTEAGTPPIMPPPPRLNLHSLVRNRYELREFLGQGTFGTVYRAWDRLANSDVAVKMLHSEASSARLYFKNEFRILKLIRHPHIVKLHDGFFEDEPWMFTMEYVPGDPLMEALAQSSRGDRDAFVRRCLGALADGLRHLHERDLQHRDLKPANIRVAQDGRVVLLDFGLARQVVDRAQGHSQSFAGSIPYIAPEQWTGESPTVASDWFALGVILYQCLTGSLPYPDGAWSLCHNNIPALPSPKDVRPEVSDDLSDLCVALLRPVASTRASHADVLGVASSAPARPVSLPTHDPFVGRTLELAALADAFALSATSPVIVHVCGGSGIGKTALLRESMARLAAGSAPANPLFLVGQCHPHLATPFPSLDSVVDELANMLRRYAWSAIEALLPRNFAALVRMFPVLGQFGPPIVNTPARDPIELRTRGFAALGEMIGRLAERRRLVIAIDDLQWGDAEGAEFLVALMNSAEAPLAMLVLAYRAEDLQRTAWLSRLRRDQGGTSRAACQFVDLGPLGDSDVERLVEASLPGAGPLDAMIRTQVVTEAAGNPYVAGQMVRWLQSSPDATRPLEPDAVFSELVSTLLPDAQTLLGLIAVSGQSTALGTVQQALPTVNLLSARDELLHHRLIRHMSIRAAEEFDIYHDRVRTGVLQRLDDTSRRALHLALATALKDRQPLEPARIAHHLAAGGQMEEAGTFALAAADRAFDVLDFASAERLYAQALTSRSVSAADRVRVLRTRGDALSNIGRGPEAAAAYLEAAKMALASEGVDLRAKASAQLIQSGQVQQGVKLLDQLMAEVGVQPPAGRWSQLAVILSTRVYFAVRGLRFIERSPVELTEQDRRRLEVAWIGTMGTSFTDPIRSAATSDIFARLALRSGSRPHVSMALAREAIAACLVSLRSDTERVQRKAQTLLDAAGELASRCEDPLFQGRCLLSRSTVAFLRGRWREAYDMADEAVEFLRSRCTNVAWEIATAHIIAFQARFIQGEWNENRRRLPDLLRDGDARGDLNATIALRVMGCTYQLDVADDTPVKAAEQLNADMARWSAEHAGFLICNAVMAKVDIALYQGEGREAYAIITKQWPRLRRSYLLRNGTTFAFLTFARARAALATAAASDTHAAEALEDARRCASGLERRGPRWSSGFARIIRAGVASLHHDEATACDHLKAGLDVFRHANMPLFQVLCTTRLKQLDPSEPFSKTLSPLDTWGAREGVRRPDRILEALLPGHFQSRASFPPSSQQSLR